MLYTWSAVEPLRPGLHEKHGTKRTLHILRLAGRRYHRRGYHTRFHHFRRGSAVFGTKSPGSGYSGKWQS